MKTLTLDQLKAVMDIVRNERKALEKTREYLNAAVEINTMIFNILFEEEKVLVNEERERLAVK